jgi:hypothetical protein
MNKPAPICYDVAEYFLRRIKKAGPEDRQELAEQVQKMCEEFCAEYRDED